MLCKVRADAWIKSEVLMVSAGGQAEELVPLRFWVGYASQ